MQAGDSLVDKVFTHGIDRAEVFVVVLSRNSIDKPWVQEELDAGMIRRIEDGTRLIPVLLDDVDVPPSLRHLRYSSVATLGIQGVVEDIRTAVFASDIAPALGPVPTYSRRLPQLTSNPVDDLVLSEAIEVIRVEGASSIGAEDLLERLPSSDLSVELIDEAIQSLREQGIIETESSLAGTTITRLRPRFWLEALRARGVDVDALHDELLVHLVNRGSTAGSNSPDSETTRALVALLVSEGLIEQPTYTMDGTAHTSPTVAGRRQARDL